ncbi:MAG TPA: hypothetical protein EYP10_04865 [Armatimonadetes bacterium]|nr:hypothetical protein [Armatimonadota bacterium]
MIGRLLCAIKRLCERRNAAMMEAYSEEKRKVEEAMGVEHVMIDLTISGDLLKERERVERIVKDEAFKRTVLAEVRKRVEERREGEASAGQR